MSDTEKISQFFLSVSSLKPVSVNEFYNTHKSYANISYNHKKKYLKGKEYTSDCGEQKMSELQQGGVLDRVRWYKEVRVKGNLQSV